MLTTLHQDTSTYPAALTHYLGDQAPPTLTTRGNVALLSRPALAFFGSVQCPGRLLLDSHDLAHQVRRAGTPVISSFHAPVEKEWLTVLLRGTNPLLLCPARSLSRMRLRAEWREPLAAGRLLLLSPFAEHQRRPTAKLARQRNRLVAALAAWIFIAYAAPGGKTESLCHEFIAWGKPLYTFQHEATAHLVEAGATPVGVTGLVERLG